MNLCIEDVDILFEKNTQENGSYFSDLNIYKTRHDSGWDQSVKSNRIPWKSFIVEMKGAGLGWARRSNVTLVCHLGT